MDGANKVLEDSTEVCLDRMSPYPKAAATSSQSARWPLRGPPCMHASSAISDAFARRSIVRDLPTSAQAADQPLPPQPRPACTAHGQNCRTPARLQACLWARALSASMLRA